MNDSKDIKNDTFKLSKVTNLEGCDSFFNWYDVTSIIEVKYFPKMGEKSIKATKIALKHGDYILTKVSATSLSISWESAISIWS